MRGQMNNVCKGCALGVVCLLNTFLSIELRRDMACKQTLIDT